MPVVLDQPALDQGGEGAVAGGAADELDTYVRQLVEHLAPDASCSRVGDIEQIERRQRLRRERKVGRERPRVVDHSQQYTFR